MKIDIVVYDSAEDDRVREFIEKYKLTYDKAHNRAEDYHDWLGVEIPDKLYTILLLLGNNWHIEKSDGAVGEL